MHMGLFVLEHRVECVYIVFWVDVQTGYVWAGVPLSVYFLALILGSVCSIWAKFSNGDNYRGRPGERRRWVLPVYRVSCMLLQASQLHLPAFPLSAFISVTVCLHRSSGLAINSDSPSSDCSFFPHPASKTQNKTQAVITGQSAAICYASVVLGTANEARH